METKHIGEHALRVETRLPFAEAIARVTERLAEEGFGIVTEIDMQATLKQKLGLETRPYHILGACNPKLAHAALDASPDVGVFLPCNVVVWDEGDLRAVVAMEPNAMSRMLDAPGLRPIAAEVSERLQRALERLDSPARS